MDTRRDTFKGALKVFDNLKKKEVSYIISASNSLGQNMRFRYDMPISEYIYLQMSRGSQNSLLPSANSNLSLLQIFVRILHSHVSRNCTDH